MNFLKTLAIFLFIFLFQNAQGAYQLQANIDSITIPYGTKLTLTMAQNITSNDIIQGDMFEAYLKGDLYLNNKLILPSRTIFRGNVSEIKYSKSLSRPAKLYLNLDHLVTSRGVQLPIDSGIASHFEYIIKHDGAITTNGNYFKAVKEDAKKASAIVPRTIKWGATSGDNLFVGAKYVFVPIAALGGCLACAGSTAYNTVADLFRKGDEIVIKKGADFDIILLSDLDIPN